MPKKKPESEKEPREWTNHEVLEHVFPPEVVRAVDEYLAEQNADVDDDLSPESHRM